MGDKWSERLSEYLDGELGADEAAALEQHLAECAKCSEALAELRLVVARIRGDPVMASDAPNDVRWARVRRAIAPRRKRWVLRAALAAGVAGLAVGGGLLLRRPSPLTYDKTSAQLETILREGRGRLRPETVKALEASLATIDTAITQAEAALAKDPGNEYVSRALAALRDTRLLSLQEAVTLVNHAGGGG